MQLNRNNSILAVLVTLSLVAIAYGYFAVPHNTSDLQELTNAKANESYDQTELLSQASKKKELEIIKNDFNTLTPQEAYQAFKDRNGNYPHGVQHEYAHLFGQELYNAIGIPGVAICDAMFAFGCFHSFFGRALVENGLDIIYDLEAACIDAYGPKGLGCQHGIGHGVLAEVGSEQLQLALETCSKLQWKGPLGGCWSGAYMEYNFNVMNDTGARALDLNDLYYPCDKVSEEFSQACYHELPQWWESGYRSLYQIQTPEIAQAYELIGTNCTGIAREEDRISCYRGLGNNIGGALSYTVKEIRDYCALAGSEEGKIHCLEGAAWLLSWEPAYKDTWEELCEGLSGRPLDICLSSKNMI